MSAAEVQQLRTGLSVLREKFPDEVVGKLPRVTCKACRDKKCSEHKPSKCQTCGGFGSPAHIHLDYVGHAEVTDRLLSADPAWNWEPLAWTEDGLPKFTKGASGELELWIRLTVCGVTRIGVGSVAGNAFDAEKQLIGDALRNASMRFGVALDLWAKEDLESQLPVDEASPRKVPTPRSRPEPQDKPPQQHVAHTRPPENREVVDTPELPPSTGTRKRKPPAAPQSSDIEAGSEFDGPTPMAGRPARSRPADAGLVAQVTDIIDALKELGDDAAQAGRDAWKAAGIPATGAGRLMQADAEKALDVLSKVYTERLTAQPTLDGDAA